MIKFFHAYEAMKGVGLLTEFLKLPVLLI